MKNIQFVIYQSSLSASPLEKKAGKESLYLDVFSTTFWETNLIFRVISADKILHDASGFKDSDRFSVRVRIGNCRYAAIRIDLQELLGLLIIRSEFNRMGRIAQPKFFQSDTDLNSIRCLRSVEVNIGFGHLGVVILLAFSNVEKMQRCELWYSKDRQRLAMLSRVFSEKMVPKGRSLPKTSFWR